MFDIEQVFLFLLRCLLWFKVSCESDVKIKLVCSSNRIIWEGFFYLYSVLRMSWLRVCNLLIGFRILRLSVAYTNRHMKVFHLTSLRTIFCNRFCGFQNVTLLKSKENYLFKPKSKKQAFDIITLWYLVVASLKTTCGQFFTN